MRKIFGGAMLFSVIGAVVLGGSLAWTSTKTAAELTSTVGTMDFTVACNPSGELLGPNGNTSTVADCTVTNTGQFNLSLVPTGTTTIIVGTNDGASCTADNFTGAVVPTGAFANPLFLLPPPAVGNTSGTLLAKILTTGGAPEGCQGAIVSWVVSVTMATAPN